VLLLVVGSLTTFLAFTNLYIVHAYYLYADGAFLLIAVAVALGSLAEYGQAPELVQRFPKRAAVAFGGLSPCWGGRLPPDMDLPDNLW
jgi:hypothetical protein